MTPVLPEARILARAKLAVYTTFFVVGFVFASWASRMVAIRDTLDFQPEQMGRLLLVGAVGSILALPVSGWVVQRIGGRRTIIVFSIVMCGGYGLTATTLGSVPIMMTGLFLFIGGIGMGVNDSAMNFEGTRVEGALKRSIMPRFHGFFSLGTMAGALVGALVARSGITLMLHVGIAIIVGFIIVQLGARWLLPAGFDTQDIDVTSPAPVVGAPAPLESPQSAPAQPSVWAAWREPRTWMIGLVVLAAALTEGAGNDWIALGVTDGFHVTEEWGSLTLFIFLTFMTVARFAGTTLIDRLGRVTVLRMCGISAIVGLILFALAPWMWLALVGAALWGLGAALGFPVGMSAASDDPRQAAARVAVVATIGYAAFFAGPPLLGELAAHVGYRNAMLAIIVPAVVSVIVAFVAQAKQPQDTNATSER